MLIVLALLRAVVGAFFAAFRPKANLVLENLALRHQLGVLQRSTPRPRLGPVDRAFWTVLSREWSRWADVLAIVKPATVIGWHRRGFARFWTNKSRPRGRPPLTDEVVALIRRMATENPLWSRRRIAAELAKLGHDVNKDTVARYMHRRPRHSGQPRSPTWGTFLRMHLAGTIAIDFLTVPTVTFNVLYVFFVLSFDRRRLLHINVTTHPYAEWAAQQIVDAVGFDTSIALLIRDRDRIYGAKFDARVNNVGIQQFRAECPPLDPGSAALVVRIAREQASARRMNARVTSPISDTRPNGQPAPASRPKTTGKHLAHSRGFRRLRRVSRRAPNTASTVPTRGRSLGRVLAPSV